MAANAALRAGRFAAWRDAMRTVMGLFMDETQGAGIRVG
jgi:hypothetical protein